MELGIDSFAASPETENSDHVKIMEELLERIVRADEVGLNSFGMGEHHRKDFLDAAPTMILSAAAALTKNVKLTSAVTVLSAADPVRVFQNFATLDLISNGRAEIVAGRGSFTDAFPLFGYKLSDYNDLFSEKLELLLKIRDSKKVTWNGKFRPSLKDQDIFPRPKQEKIPIWLGVGGTPASFVRAGLLGLPLMVAIIGGETHRFKPLIDLYKKGGAEAGFKPEELKVGMHCLGYLAESSEEAVNKYFPGYKKVMDKVGKERGFGPVSKESFNAHNGPKGALLVGSSDEVAEKIKRHSDALGGVSRVTLNMDVGVPHSDLLKSIDLLGKEVAPILKYH